MSTAARAPAPELEGARHQPRVEAERDRGFDEGVDPLCRHGLRLGVLEKALLAVASADARVLHPAHWRVDAPVGRRVRLVDVDRSGLDAAGEFAPPILVPGPHRRVQAVLGVVRPRDRLLVVDDGVDAHDRSERLLTADVHVLLDVGEDRRLVEVGSHVGAGSPSAVDRRAVGPRVLDVRLDPLQLVGRGERSHLRTEVVGRLGSAVVHGVREPLDELLVHRLVDVDQPDADAGLSRVVEAAPDQAPDRAVEVGVRPDDRGVLPPEFERARREVLAGLRRDLPADRRRAGEPHVIHSLDQRRADVLASPRDDLEDVLGEPRLAEESLGVERDVCGLLGRLADDGVTGQ